MTEPPPGQPPYGPPPPGYYPPPPPGYYAPYPPPPRAPYAIGAALNWAWQKFGKHWKVLVSGMVPLIVVGLAFYATYIATLFPFWLDGVRGETQSDTDVFDMYVPIGLIFAVLLVLTIPLSVVQANLMRAALMIADGETPSLRVLVTTKRAGRIMLTALGIGLVTLAGMILCVLPGLAFAAFSSFTLLFIVDQDMKTIDAISASFALVKAHLGLALLTLLVIGAIGYAGSMACLIGVAVSYPVGILMQVYAYRALIQGQVVP